MLWLKVWVVALLLFQCKHLVSQVRPSLSTAIHRLDKQLLVALCLSKQLAISLSLQWSLSLGGGFPPQYTEHSQQVPQQEPIWMVSSFNWTYDASSSSSSSSLFSHIKHNPADDDDKKFSSIRSHLLLNASLEIIMPVNCLSDGQTGHHCRALLTTP